MVVNSNDRGVPKMNCGGELPEWEFILQPGGVTISEKPEICKECEFFQVCFMNRTSEILGLPMRLGEEAMRQLVYLQRLQDAGADDATIGAYLESLHLPKQ